MDLGDELASRLREVVQFLECLREVKLPVTLERIRDNLLIQSKKTLAMFRVEMIDGSGSPEEYLNMYAAGPKGLLAASKGKSEIQRCVGAEERCPRKQQQDYYEAFQTIEATSDNASARNEADQARSYDEEMENMQMEMYASFSVAQTRSKCHKCGFLDRKEGKKLFVFEQYRTYWVGLVGPHLLIYGSDRDNRPCIILPIRGYRARAAPNAISRDQRRSEATFEIFCPGSKTFQFIARSPQDMQQWVMKICELAGDKRNETKERSKILMNVSVENDASTSEAQESNSKERRHQDIGPLVIDKTVPEDATGTVNVTNGDGETTIASTPKEPPSDIANSAPPPLPARIPRKLPSLPDRGTVSSYVCPDEEEDDIYHRIDDLKQSVHCYGNVGEAAEPVGSPKELETYDDVGANTKEESRIEDRPKKNRDSVATESINVRNEMTYDDASSTISLEDETNEQNKLVSYDDVENLVSNARMAKTQETEKTEKVEAIEQPAKTPQKKSFLDRVRSRKESPKRIEKKSKIPTLPPANLQELPIYDDVSDLTNAQEKRRSIETETEYIFPPPPRPIYAKPPPLVEPIDQQEFYDDVSAYREKYKDEETCKVDQRTPKKLNYAVCPGGTENVILCENTEYSQQTFEDNEHYQTPRVEPTQHHKHLPTDQQEELYDDIAILAEFKARQKEILGRKDSEETMKTQTSREKRSRNGFINGKKSKMIDSTGSETNNLRSSGTENTDETDEQHSLVRMNTFQRLISKMENSFSKASVKIAQPVLSNKTNVTNNA